MRQKMNSIYWMYASGQDLLGVKYDNYGDQNVNWNKWLDRRDMFGGWDPNTVLADNENNPLRYVGNYLRAGKYIYDPTRSYNSITELEDSLIMIGKYAKLAKDYIQYKKSQTDKPVIYDSEQLFPVNSENGFVDWAIYRLSIERGRGAVIPTPKGYNESGFGNISINWKRPASIYQESKEDYIELPTGYKAVANGQETYINGQRYKGYDIWEDNQLTVQWKRPNVDELPQPKEAIENKAWWDKLNIHLGKITVAGTSGAISSIFGAYIMARMVAKTYGQMKQPSKVKILDLTGTTYQAKIFSSLFSYGSNLVNAMGKSQSKISMNQPTPSISKMNDILSFMTKLNGKQLTEFMAIGDLVSRKNPIINDAQAYLMVEDLFKRTGYWDEFSNADKQGLKDYMFSDAYINDMDTLVNTPIDGWTFKKLPLEAIAQENVAARKYTNGRVDFVNQFPEFDSYKQPIIDEIKVEYKKVYENNTIRDLMQQPESNIREENGWDNYGKSTTEMINERIAERQNPVEEEDDNLAYADKRGIRIY